jgi:hypothetical protein
MKKQPSAVEAVFLFASHRVPSSMYSQTSSSHCSDPSVAKDLGLIFPREHLDGCQACREAMIDHASRITLKEVATEKGLSVEEVICELGLVAIALQKDARQRGVPLRVVVKELLAGLNRI